MNQATQKTESIPPENLELTLVDRFCIELQDHIVDHLDSFDFRNGVAKEWYENYNSRHGSKWGQTFDRLLKEAELREYVKKIGSDWEYCIDDDGNKIPDKHGAFEERTLLNHEITRAFNKMVQETRPN